MSIYAYYLNYFRKNNICPIFTSKILALILYVYLPILALGDTLYLVCLKKEYATVKHIVSHIDTLPLIIKIFAIHFWWIYVIMAILMLFSAIKPLSFVNAKNYNMGIPLMKIKIQRLSLRYIFNFTLGIIFALLVFLLFVVILKMYGAGIALVLGILLIAIEFVINRSIILTKEGVLIQRGFYDFFFSYTELYPLNESSLKNALETHSFSMAFSHKGKEDFGIYLYWEDISMVEKILNLYQEKTKEHKNHTKDSNAS